MSLRGSLNSRTFSRYAREEHQQQQIDTVSEKITPPNIFCSNDPSAAATAIATTIANLHQPDHSLIKPTWKRYVILFLFCLNAGNKAFQWIQVAASTKKATLLYSVDNYVINVTSTIFMLSFIVLSWPACYIIDTCGLRNSVLWASFGTAVGALVKCFSCHETGIWLLMLGQLLVSLSEQLIFSVPSRLASVWFPDHQVSSAVAFCVFGQQVGIALGFVIPQWYLNEAETKSEISAGFYGMFLLTTIVSVLAYLLDYLLFDEEPEFAPGAARLKQRQLERQLQQLEQNESKESILSKMGKLFSQIGKLLNNRHLVMLSMSYGMNVGLGYTIPTLLNQLLQPIWPDDDLIVGNTGFMIVVAGALGLPIWGRSMDSWHAYKFMNVLLTVATIGSLLIFTYVLIFIGSASALALYVAALLLGFFMAGFTVTGLELAVELTYPEPELVTSSLMNVMPQIFGTLFIVIGSFIVDNYGPLATSGFFLACLVAALLFLLATKETLKRQQAIKQQLAGNKLLSSSSSASFGLAA